jgi:glutamyl-tRNA synthetase
MEKDPSVRVRFAPSPTGYLHVGGARTALFNYLFARSHGGKYILRIEDTDQVRSTDLAAKQVLESLKWLGMEWDEGPEVGGPNGPYYQAQRLSIYKEKLEELKNGSHVYACFCTDAELTEKKNRAEALGLPSVYDGRCRNFSAEEVATKISQGIQHTWRFKAENRVVSFDDRVRGLVRFDTKLTGDFVIVKSDGFPTYNFAVVVDDAMMKITHVLRGDDHISNTPRQILIYEALGYPVPVFCHISMILGANKEKLSKRHGATDLLEFKEQGYLPDALLNHLALLGWAPSDGVEIISKEKLKQVFLGTSFNASPAVFDYAKLNFINAHAIRSLSPDQARKEFGPFLDKISFVSEFRKRSVEDQKAMLEAVRPHCQKLSDIEKELSVFFNENLVIAEEAKPEFFTGEATKALVELALSLWKTNSSDFISGEEMKILQNESKTKLNLGGKKFFKPMRLALTGVEHGLELDHLFRLVRRERLLKRLEFSLSQIKLD